MSPLSSIKIQATEKHDKIVNKLHKEVYTFFYDSMMYDINDALTSILAVSDMEGRGAVPKIKQYIHRINKSLNNTKNYQNKLSEDNRFNIGTVISNLIHVIKDNFRDENITHSISNINAHAEGNQMQFERMLLHIFVGMITGKQGTDSEMLIELRQRDKNAIITILKDSCSISDEAMEIINKIKDSNKFTGSVNIVSNDEGVEVSIKIPLKFKLINIVKKIKMAVKTRYKKRLSVKINNFARLNTVARETALDFAF